MPDPVETAICAALGYHGPDWLERACRAIEMHQRVRNRFKAYELDTIGGRLRCARELAGMTQTVLGKRIGMSWQHVASLEAGRANLPAVKVHAIAVTLKVKPAWLLCTTDDGGPEAKYGIKKPGNARKIPASGREEARMLNEARKRRQAQEAAE